MLLKPEHRAKLDEADDQLFYDFPRFVTHVDESFLAQLTDLYRQRLKPGMRVLDLMSSWVSHLPDEMDFAHVKGHGMNAEELARNPQFDHFFVQNLNLNPQLPIADQDFDAVLITVSVQYLQYPEAIFSEIHRILKPGGVVIITFSNRMFPQKAVQIWRENSESARVELVKHYLQGVSGAENAEFERSGFEHIEAIANITPVNSLLQMLGLASDPFYAVLAHRSFTDTQP